MKTCATAFNFDDESDEAASGPFFVAIHREIGILEQMKPYTLIGKNGYNSAAVDAASYARARRLNKVYDRSPRFIAPIAKTNRHCRNSVRYAEKSEFPGSWISSPPDVAPLSSRIWRLAILEVLLHSHSECRISRRTAAVKSDRQALKCNRMQPHSGRKNAALRPKPRPAPEHHFCEMQIAEVSPHTIALSVHGADQFFH